MNYRQPNPFYNPFDKRRIAPAVRRRLNAPQCPVVDERGYGLRFYNQVSVFQKRGLGFRGSLASSIQRRSVWQVPCLGNGQRASSLLRLFLHRLIKDCKEKPVLFQDNAEKLRQMMKEEGLEILHFQAFEQIWSLDQLWELLESILEKNGVFQFDLAAAAVLQAQENLSAP